MHRRFLPAAGGEPAGFDEMTSRALGIAAGPEGARRAHFLCEAGFCALPDFALAGHRPMWQLWSMTSLRSIAVLASLATPALAQSPMSGAEFEAYTEGRTLYFDSAGGEYGVEEYLPGRRVRWSFLDGRCLDGIWYEADGMICFVYEEYDDPQCWTFFRQGQGLRALFENDPASTQLYEARQTEEPMLCYGPDIGV